VAIFLNVVAVGFLLDIDNMMGKFLINPRAIPSHEDALENLRGRKDIEMRLPVRWLENRIFAAALCASIGFEALFMTELILFLNPIFGGPLFNIANRCQSQAIFEHRKARFTCCFHHPPCHSLFLPCPGLTCQCDRAVTESHRPPIFERCELQQDHFCHSSDVSDSRFVWLRAHFSIQCVLYDGA
jgi:hypothetical protein